MLVSLETAHSSGGNETFMRPPKILVETEVVSPGLVWKIKKALCVLRTSPPAWETERDNTLKALKWIRDEVEYRLLSCPGSPCLWTIVPFRPGDAPKVKRTRGVVITFVDDLLLSGWQRHVCNHQGTAWEIRDEALWISPIWWSRGETIKQWIGRNRLFRG